MFDPRPLYCSSLTTAVGGTKDTNFVDSGSLYRGMNHLPVIISASLTVAEEEDKLLRLLRDHKDALGWSMADLKGIRPSMCMHRILLEDGHKPSVEAQRRLNPTMKEVVRKEVLKWLDAVVIYPISDSAWVSPVQVVPKNGGTTVIKTKNNILLPSKTVIGWRICIDY